MIDLEALGLGNVDNTSDIDKPITTAQRAKIDKLVNTSDFTTLHAIPGLPVHDASMMFLPVQNFCDINADGKVNSLKDPITGIEVTQATATKKPELKVDSQGREYLRFVNDELVKTNLESKVIAGENNKTTSFLLVAKIHSASDGSQTQMGWVANRTQASRFSTHFCAGERLVVDSGAQGSNRLEITGNGVGTQYAGKIASFYFERNENNAGLWIDGVSIVHNTTMGSGITSELGRFSLGRAYSESYYCNMDFYGLILYNRVLTEQERKKMFLFSKKVYGV